MPGTAQIRSADEAFSFYILMFSSWWMLVVYLAANLFAWSAPSSVTHALMLVIILAIALNIKGRSGRCVAAVALLALVQVEWVLQAWPQIHWTPQVQDCQFCGTIEQLEQVSPDRTQWIATGFLDNTATAVRLQLSHYRPRVDWHIGDAACWRVSLKPLTALYNFEFGRPGLAAVTKRLHGSARVLAIQSHQPAPWGLSQWRGRIMSYIRSHVSLEHLQGPLIALSVGVNAFISPEVWQVLRDSGTAHLMAISGLHVGLIAWIVQRITRRLGYQTSAMCALITAWGYGALAGFSVPTQRACLFITAYLWAQWAHWKMAFVPMLTWSVLCIVSIEPLSTLMPGFWLSFSAVLLLRFLAHWGYSWWALQWRMTLGLLPMSILFFGSFAPLSVFTNLLAIPCVGVAILPLLWASLCTAVVLPTPSLWLLHNSAEVFQLLWSLLEWTQLWPAWIIGHLNMTQWIVLLYACLGLMLPLRRTHLCILGLMLLGSVIPVQRFFPAKVAEITTVAVGQGTAVLIETQTHRLLVDTGPRSHNPLVAVLKQQGIQHFDKVIISHGDDDHAGALPKVLDHFAVDQIWSSEPQRIQTTHRVCHAGDSWDWDGVKFNILHPSSPDQHKKSNEKSCVLLISSGDQHVLLAGDIGASTEKRLLKEQELPALQALWVPHHGSRYSSSPAWVEHLRPRYAIFTTGAWNHYGFPHPTVWQRYQNMNSMCLDTAEVGAIRFRLTATGIQNVTWAKRQRWMAYRLLQAVQGPIHRRFHRQDLAIHASVSK